ncbi:protein FLORAL ORGAN NUMBER2-like [Phragmites australis]|uniref:protein FLORAL ORGAN NUMBER2-like n=1 Tax=Phragmites australis TaxID=29695 RepID=UPI002D773752|nr:protein FLORAL ORGAN NUMBER2-like [Phragmites australis]
MGRRSSLCLAAVACSCCLALLLVLPAVPVQERVGLGLAGGSGGRDYLLPEPRFRVTELNVVVVQRTGMQPEEQQRGMTMKATRSSWSSTPAAGWVRTELRSVPGGPDPMHHHRSPRRPEQERATP